MTRSEGFTRWLEGNAQGMRQLAGIGPAARLIPRAFAEALGYTIVFPHEIEGLAERDLRQLTRVDVGGWSGSSAILPSGHPVVVLNPSDAVTRNNITIMEELAHDYLGHNPSLSSDGRTGLRERSFSKAQEKQAYALGAAAVLPSRRLQIFAVQHVPVWQIARSEELSERVVRYRLQVSGIGRAA